MGVLDGQIYDMYPIMHFGHWSGGGVCVYAGMMQARGFIGKHWSTELLPSMKALSDCRLYPESAFHWFININ